MTYPAPRLLLVLLAFATAARLAANGPKPTQAPAAPARPDVVWVNPYTGNAPGVSHHVLQSEAMQRPVGYCVYLPPGYESSGQRYPVVYFLHGMGGKETSDGPAFSEIVGRMIASGAVPPAICVFPNGGHSGYRDHPDTGINVETMIVRELVPKIDAEYRTRPDRDSRFLGGFSMGGGGSLRLALLYPELFGAAASWAGALSRSEPHLPADVAQALATEKPPVRLLLIVGYEDITFAAHPVLIDAFTRAKQSFTYVTIPDLGHQLGRYYTLTGDTFVRFLLAPTDFPAPTR